MNDNYLETPLMEFPHESGGKDIWTVDDATKGVAILGGTGSGKTSASGRKLALKFLNEQWGGIVLCAKPDEAKLWYNYCEETGRLDDLVMFEKDAVHKGEQNKFKGQTIVFNPIDYEMKRKGAGSGDTQNIVNIFMNIYRMGNRIASEGDISKEERFWDSAIKRCIGRAVELLKLSRESLSVYNIYKILISCTSRLDNNAADSPMIMNEDTIADCINYIEDTLKANAGEEDVNADELDHKYRDDEEYFGVYCLAKAYYDLLGKDEYIPKEQYEYEMKSYRQVYSYFVNSLNSLDPRTKSTIIESFMGLAEPFLSGILNKHFAGENNIEPEETFRDKKIIVLNFPVKEFLDVGIIAQCVFKLMFQQAVERRNTDEYPTPVFLWADEAQMFVNPYDQIFLTTARSARASTVYLTQNISNYLAVIGSGSDSKAKVDSLLGNLSTKIFHANMDAVTNEYASRLIGQEIFAKESANRGHTAFSIKDTDNLSYSMDLMPQVLPKEFTTLKSGGEKNGGKVEAIMMISGKKWLDKKNFQRVTFKQKLK